jgi:predicted transcriptional regulator
MTSLTMALSPALARRLAGCADRLGLSHMEVATLALRLFLAAERTNERTNERTRSDQARESAETELRWRNVRARSIAN